MNKYYISSNCYLLNKKLYIDNLDSKDIKINNRNWKKYLKDYGWTTLPINWRRKLNNTNFGILDCGANGDCLFHVFAEGLNLDNIYNNKIDDLYHIGDIRKLSASAITPDNFNIIIENYRCENDFGLWDPYSINKVEELQEEIIKEGDNFWGDHIILQLIQDKLKLNVILLNEEDIHYMVNDINKYDKTIIIYYLGNIHFQLIGFFNGNYFKTIFNNNEIPKCLLALYNR